MCWELCFLYIIVNVNVYVYSLIFHRVQQTSQFKPLVLELSHVQSHLIWGEFSTFSAADVIHNSPFFVPPGIHHWWVNRDGMIWEACPTPLHMSGSVTRAPVTHPSTNIEHVIWYQVCCVSFCVNNAIRNIWILISLSFLNLHYLENISCICVCIFTWIPTS